MMDQQPKLLDRVRDASRLRHFSPRTEEAYVMWIRWFVLFHGKRHPSAMGGGEVNQFLTHLAVDRHVSASTQNQALSALLFLYRVILDDPLPWLDDLVRAQRPLRVPVVLTIDEVRSVLQNITGVPHLVALLLYGSGLRLLQALTLRVKDLDFARSEIVVRDPKGKRDRRTMLPRGAVDQLHEHLVEARATHEEDLAYGFGAVWLPTALERKLPKAAVEWRWQWVFPATRRWRDAETGRQFRHHLHETEVQHAVRAAAEAAGISKRVGCHTFRHSLRRICWSGAMTFGRCRSFSVTAKCRQR
jgi:integron integrase